LGWKLILAWLGDRVCFLCLPKLLLTDLLVKNLQIRMEWHSKLLRKPQHSAVKALAELQGCHNVCGIAGGNLSVLLMHSQLIQASVVHSSALKASGQESLVFSSRHSSLNAIKVSSTPAADSPYACNHMMPCNVHVLAGFGGCEPHPRPRLRRPRATYSFGRQRLHCMGI